jgi:opacity protein-like surface antigen
MRILLAALLVAFAALLGAPAQAADMPDYPDIEIPEVDYGLEGSFYLRGSAAVNLMWTQEHLSPGCGCSTPPTVPGYGYSIGAGFGYETGTGLRFDGTIDYLQNDGLTDGTNFLHLRSAVGLVNAYYDIPLSHDGSLGGGFGAYVGGGVGAAAYTTHVTGPGSPADGGGWTPAAAAMTGVTYDAGQWVADLGYRMIYMPKISNYVVGDSFYLNDNTFHEVRGTVRYRFQ